MSLRTWKNAFELRILIDEGKKCLSRECSNLCTTTLAKKIETTARTGVQVRALSSMHAPVVWHAWLSRFFWPSSSTVTVLLFMRAAKPWILSSRASRTHQPWLLVSLNLPATLRPTGWGARSEVRNRIYGVFFRFNSAYLPHVRCTSDISVLWAYEALICAPYQLKCRWCVCSGLLISRRSDRKMRYVLDYVRQYLGVHHWVGLLDSRGRVSHRSQKSFLQLTETLSGARYYHLREKENCYDRMTITAYSKALPACRFWASTVGTIYASCSKINILQRLDSNG